MRPDWRASSPNSARWPGTESNPDEKGPVTDATLATTTGSLQSAPRTSTNPHTLSRVSWR